MNFYFILLGSTINCKESKHVKVSKFFIEEKDSFLQLLGLHIALGNIYVLLWKGWFFFEEVDIELQCIFQA